MNVHPDMLRSQNMAHIPPTMLNLGGQSFMQQPQQQQQQQHQSMQQGMPPQLHMPGAGGPNPSMSMSRAGQPGPMGNSTDPAFQLQIQQANQRMRRDMNPTQTPQGLPSAGVGPNHVNGMGHNTLQGLGIPNGPMTPSNQLRRVPSQTQQLVSGPHLGQLQQGMGGMNGMGTMTGMGMPPQGQHMRQAVQAQQIRFHQPQQPQQQQQQQQQMQGQHMPLELSMTMPRQTHIPGNPALPPHAPRTVSAQSMMNGMGQPNGIPQSHSGGMQNSMHHGAFQPGIPLSHQQPQISSSPLGGSHSQSHTPATMSASIPATGPMPPQGVNRTHLTTPDNAMFPFPGNPMQSSMPHNSVRVANGPQSFSFMPSPSPSTSLGDLSQGTSGGPMTASVSRVNTGMMITPAQMAEHMNQSRENDAFSFNSSQTQVNAPPRPPSHNAPHTNFPMPPQHPQMQHQSPRQSDQLNGHLGQAQRPQSQQGHQRQSPQQQSQPRTPHASSGPLPMSAGMHPGRIPMPGPPGMPPQVRPPSSAGPPTGMQLSMRQSQGPAPAPPSTTATSAAPSESQPTAPPAAPTTNTSGRVVYNLQYPVLGFGQGIQRLLQLSGILGSEAKEVSTPPGGA